MATAYINRTTPNPNQSMVQILESKIKAASLSLPESTILTSQDEDRRSWSEPQGPQEDSQGAEGQALHHPSMCHNTHNLAWLIGFFTKQSSVNFSRFFFAVLFVCSSTGQCNGCDFGLNCDVCSNCT